MAASWFSDVKEAPAIEVFALTAACKEDPDPHKVNLGVGAYRTNDGEPWVLPVVRKVESQMAGDGSLNHEYLGVAGDPDYRKAATKLLLGENSPAIKEERADSVQALGGTGALRVGMDFLRNVLGLDTIYASTPTWGNHNGIAKSLHFPNIMKYRYWNQEKRILDIDGMLEDLQNAKERSVILLHMCAHNPSGIDPTKEQWERIAQVIRAKNHFPFFDCAYQGFSSGDTDKDAQALRYFVEQGFEVFAAQSFSKNFGLYNERVGNLIYVLNNKNMKAQVASQMMIIIRTTWSNSSAHGCRVVSRILNNPDLKKEWLGHVQTMAHRILEMRDALQKKLEALKTPGKWDHITKQTGMFSYTGLSPAQSAHMVKKYHVYLLSSGRINMCGLTTHNIDYVANAIDETVRNVKDDCKL